MDYAQFLNPELLIVVVVLVFIGLVLKRIEKVSDEFIPVILGILGILIVCLKLGFNIGSVLQGIIAAACAVYGNQTFKQAIKYNDKTEETKPPNEK